MILGSDFSVDHRRFSSRGSKYRANEHPEARKRKLLGDNVRQLSEISR
jgi:hypothetical protein